MVLQDCPYKINEWGFKNRTPDRKPRYPRAKCKYYSRKNIHSGVNNTYIRECCDPCPLELHRRKK